MIEMSFHTNNILIQLRLMFLAYSACNLPLIKSQLPIRAVCSHQNYPRL